MPNTHTCTPYNTHAPYFPMPKKPGNHTILALDEPDIWFDAQDSIQIEETWFDAGSVAYTGKHSPEENADSLVPFTEDCRRSIQQFVRTLGDYQEGKILSACISKLLPGVPVNLAMAANSLYTFITQRKNIDTAALHALGLASWYLPDDFNTISQLASFIRNTVTNWTGETFLHEFLGNEEKPTFDCLFTALAITSIVAGRWMKDHGTPQRASLKVPAFIANLFIRASHYWNALGNMISNNTPSASTFCEQEPAAHSTPAFEVDTCVEMATDSPHLSLLPLKPQITAFSSNSTTTPEAFFQATVSNKPVPRSYRNYSLAEQAHILAMDKLRQQSSLAGLMNCLTRTTETRQQVNEKTVFNSYFNTQCDATVSPEPEKAKIDVLQSIPSSTTSRNGAEPLLPLVAIAATVPVATSYIHTLKSKTAIAAGSVVGLTGITVAGKLLWDKLTPPQQVEINSNQAKITDDGKNIRQAEASIQSLNTYRTAILSSANMKIIKLLKKSDLLAPGKNKYTDISKETMLAVTANYLSRGTGNYEEKIKLLARKILSADSQYGGKKDQQIPQTQAESVVRSWVFHNIFGASLENHIINKMNDGTIDLDATVATLSDHLTLARMFLDGNLDYNEFKKTYSSDLCWMFDYFIIAEMPFLKLEFQPTLRINDIEFANLYSGSRFLQTTTTEPYSYIDAITTGENMWNIAIHDGITEDRFVFYKTPVQFFSEYTSSINEKWTKTDVYNSLNLYLSYRKMINELPKEIEEKFHKYQSAISKWVSKGSLADNIIAKCSTLPQYFPSRGDAQLAPEMKRKMAEYHAKQAYLIGEQRPCPEAPASLDNAYRQLTSNVADAFRDFDEYIILSAINSLPENDLKFISSLTNSVHPASIEMVSNLQEWGGLWGTVPIYKNRNLSTKAVFFAVHQKKEQRIYALIPGKGDNENHRIIRVDKSILKCILYGIFEYDFGDKYKIDYNDSTVTIGRNRFRYTLTVDEQINKKGQNNLSSLVDWIKNKHRDKLFDDIYKSGNENSNIRKVWDVIRHLIPFYDCTTGIIDKDPDTAVPGCISDAVALIPAVGTALSMSTKFGISIARGVSRGTAVLSAKGATKTAGKKFLQEVRLPTISEFPLLGKNALRAIDPGFELLVSVGRKFTNKVLILLNTNKHTAELAKKIILPPLPENLALPDNIIMATLKPINLQVPVKAIGREYGKVVYVRINPETGEMFGDIFIIDTQTSLVKVKNIGEEYGGIHAGQSIPARLEDDMAELRHSIDELKSGSCSESGTRSRRQINCLPFSLSTQALIRVLEYATVFELTILARNPAFQNSIFIAMRETINADPERANGLINRIVYLAMQNNDLNLLSPITLGLADPVLYNALNSYHQRFRIPDDTHTNIESLRILGIYPPRSNPEAVARFDPAGISYTVIDDDGTDRRLNVIAHGRPGGLTTDFDTDINADELYANLLRDGILNNSITKIILFMCHSAEAPQEGISVAQRLSQLTGMPVVGFHGTVVIYENIVFGNAVLPVHNFIIDAYTHGGLMGANAMLEHLRPFFSIKMLPDAQRLTETFAPPPAI